MFNFDRFFLWRKLKKSPHKSDKNVPTDFLTRISKDVVIQLMRDKATEFFDPYTNTMYRLEVNVDDTISVFILTCSGTE